MTYNEFKRSILNLDKPRKHRIKGSLGIYDGYKYYRKNKPKDKIYILTESQYFAITRKINLLLAEELINGEEVKFPYKMGKLELRKIDSMIKIKEGKVVSNLPINWDVTLKLWYEDEEAFKERTLIKMEEKEVFKIYYNKYLANYKNKSYYEFEVNRDIKKRLKHKIKEGRIEALYLNKTNRYG